MTNKLRRDFGVIRLNEVAMNDVAMDPSASITGILYFLIYGFALYAGLQSIPSELLKALPQVYSITPQNFSFIASYQVVFDFVMILILHFTASLFSPSRSFWPFFRIVSRVYIFGVLSVFFSLNIIMLWKYVLIYKALKFYYGFSALRSVFVIILSFIISIALNIFMMNLI